MELVDLANITRHSLQILTTIYVVKVTKEIPNTKINMNSK